MLTTTNVIVAFTGDTNYVGSDDWIDIFVLQITQHLKDTTLDDTNQKQEISFYDPNRDDTFQEYPIVISPTLLMSSHEPEPEARTRARASARART